MFQAYHLPQTKDSDHPRSIAGFMNTLASSRPHPILLFVCDLQVSGTSPKVKHSTIRLSSHGPCILFQTCTFRLPTSVLLSDAQDTHIPDQVVYSFVSYVFHSQKIPDSPDIREYYFCLEYRLCFGNAMSSQSLVFSTRSILLILLSSRFICWGVRSGRLEP